MSFLQDLVGVPLSIAVVLDAVNNLSDAVSSIITIVGTASQTKYDYSHPSATDALNT